MHSTPNYYMRNTNQNNEKKSNHTGQNGHTKKSTDKCISGLARDVTAPAPCLTLSVGLTLATATESTASPSKEKTFKGVKPRI